MIKFLKEGKIKTTWNVLEKYMSDKQKRQNISEISLSKLGF